MNLAFKAVGRINEQQPKILETTKYVRKDWVIFAAYYAASSSAVGLGVAATMFLFAALGVSKHGNHKPMPIHAAWVFSVAIFAVVSAIAFLIQLIGGPFVFTKDVVCRKCRARLKVNRIAFFTGKYSRPPRCNCGGKIEPAFLWKPQDGAAETQSVGS